MDCHVNSLPEICEGRFSQLEDLHKENSMAIARIESKLDNGLTSAVEKIQANQKWHGWLLMGILSGLGMIIVSAAIVILEHVVNP